jgi:hypothetical protein
VLRKVVSSEAELTEMLAEAGVVVAKEVIVADEAEPREMFAVFDADEDGNSDMSTGYSSGLGTRDNFLLVDDTRIRAKP